MPIILLSFSNTSSLILICYVVFLYFIFKVFYVCIWTVVCNKGFIYNTPVAIELFIPIISIMSFSKIQFYLNNAKIIKRLNTFCQCVDNAKIKLIYNYVSVFYEKS